MVKKVFLQCVVTTTLVLTLATLAAGDVSAQAMHFPEKYINHKKEVKGGTLRVGYASDNAFKGIFLPGFDDDLETNEMATPGENDLFKSDKNGKFAKGGIADIKFDRNNKTALVTVGKHSRWSDGRPVTARDVAFTYEVIANKDSVSPYYSDEVENVVGIKEYHLGQTDKIAGLEEKDDRHLVIHFKEMFPAMEYRGSSYLFDDAYPYHYLKDIPISQLAQNEKVREHPLFYGPYTLRKVVAGESMEWVPNKYYAGPKPRLDKIVMEVVPQIQAVAAMKAKKYDVLMNVSGIIYDGLSKDKDIVTLGELSRDIDYLGFKVGYKNKDGMSVMDRSLPTSNKALRQAMAHSINIQQLIDKYGRGMTEHANSLLSPAFGTYYAKNVKAYDFSLKKANKILDRAGFKRQKNGYRTTPEGKKLTLTMLDSGSGKGSEFLRKNYMQLWKKVGLHVVLYRGRALDYSNFLDELNSSKKRNFDFWMGSWSLTQDPTNLPTAAFKANSPFNYGHFVTKENNELIASLNSKKAFNEKYRIDQMRKWQRYMQKEAYVVPLQYTYRLEMVNKKVSGVSIEDNSDKLNDWDGVVFTER